MRVRNRTSGVGPRYETVVSTKTNCNVQHTVSWYYDGNGSEAPVLQDQLVDFWGTEVVIPAPPVVKYPRGWAGDTSNPTWLATCSQIIQEKVLPLSVVAYYYPANLALATNAYEQRVMTDVISAEFKKRQRDGERVVNPCDAEWHGYTAPVVSLGTDWFQWTTTDGGATFNACHLNVAFGSLYYPSVRLGANFHTELLEALSNIPLDSDLDSMYADAFASKDDAEMELLTSIAEAKKTLSYIEQRLGTLASILNSARRGDFSFLGKKAKDLDPASLWLEARYAVRPIIIDVENCMRAISEDGNLLKTLRTGNYNSFGDDVTVTWSHTTDSGITGVVELNVNYSEYASAGLYSRLQLDWPSIKNLGLTNVARTFWEVIPWSFVLDWFVNTAGVISLLNPNPIYNPLSGWTSLRRTSLIDGSFTFTANEEEFKIPISGISQTYRRKKEDLPSPIVIDVNLSIPKLLDLLSFGSKR